MNLRGLDLGLIFPEAWSLRLAKVTATGSLEVGPYGVYFDVIDAQSPEGGTLEILGYRLPLTDVRIKRVGTTRAYPEDIYLHVLGMKTNQATTVGKGFFKDVYGYTPGVFTGIDMDVEIAHAADALNAVVSGAGLKAATFSGDRASLKLRLDGDFEALKLKLSTQQLNASWKVYALHKLESDVHLDLATPIHVDVKKFNFTSPAGGSVRSAGMLSAGGTKDAPPFSFKTRLDLNALDISPWILKQPSPSVVTSMDTSTSRVTFCVKVCRELISRISICSGRNDLTLRAA